MLNPVTQANVVTLYGDHAVMCRYPDGDEWILWATSRFWALRGANDLNLDRACRTAGRVYVAVPLPFVGEVLS